MRFWKRVKPVINPEVRELCLTPYPGHPKGCPNYGQRSSCPPQAPMLGKILDLSLPIYAIWNVYSLEEHVVRMKAKHPDWSERQLYCCLYWQGRARKELKENIQRFLQVKPGCIVLTCPEACGVDVTATMKLIGIELDWPPREEAYQIALAGYGKG